ncbi:hypothetical protein G9A89_020878 [Geosiphon pyriformis]|nr:hypothetical protein G9A89_020878 [Geosiphon pyriformis]
MNQPFLTSTLDQSFDLNLSDITSLTQDLTTNAVQFNTNSYAQLLMGETNAKYSDLSQDSSNEDIQNSKLSSINSLPGNSETDLVTELQASLLETDYEEIDNNRGFNEGAIIVSEIPKSFIKKLINGEGPEDNQTRKRVKNEDQLELLTSFARYAKAPICETDKLKSYSDEIKVISGVDHKKKQIIFSFRSDKYEKTGQFMRNITLTQYQEFRIARVHYLVDQEFSMIKKMFLNELDSLVKINPGFSIGLTGFSWGGGYAILAGLEALKQYPGRTIQVFTYGQPRIGNIGFANIVSRKLTVYRVTNLDDLVPHKPPQHKNINNQKWKYHHHDTEFWIGSYNGPVFQCQSFIKHTKFRQENEACANSAELPYDIQAHEGPYFNYLMNKEYCNAESYLP